MKTIIRWGSIPRKLAEVVTEDHRIQRVEHRRKLLFQSSSSTIDPKTGVVRITITSTYG